MMYDYLVKSVLQIENRDKEESYSVQRAKIIDAVYREQGIHRILLVLRKVANENDHRLYGNTVGRM